MLHHHIVRYLIGGFSVFLVSIGLLYLFVDLMGIWYLWGTTLAYVISIGLSFTVQKYWTFRDHSSDGMAGQMSVYVLLQLINLGSNDVLMYISVGRLGIPHLIAQVCTTGVIAAWSFIAYRFLFSRKAVMS